ncbi:hypothetical protein GCM10012275_44130 [Longimycelium tulufanense]|uniref:Secreted protein n=1 Tax=Longimycelium tulufanense TaxID=907463 RepID=A0A8J3CHT3_9PSEU|nr:hypothetical protein [Longimycelium tulufanense]GGM68845.1 hypothetical protein GCM10012275_44130 [Longimycelium tulufanense]
MLKKTAGVVAATAAGLAMMSAPAMAGGYGHHGEIEDNDWNGAVNILNANQIQIPICVAQNNIGVLGAAVPILSPMFMGTCAESKAALES